MRWNGKANVVNATVTTDTNGYAAGDVIGSVLTLENAVREPKTGIFNSLTLLADGSHSLVLDILVFDRDPTDAAAVGGTPATVTNNAAFAWGESGAHLIGMVSVEAADWSAALDSKQIVCNDALAIQIKGRSLPVYLVVISRGTPTFTSGQVVRIKAGFIQD